MPLWTERVTRIMIFLVDLNRTAAPFRSPSTSPTKILEPPVAVIVAVILPHFLPSVSRIVDRVSWEYLTLDLADTTRHIYFNHFKAPFFQLNYRRMWFAVFTSILGSFRNKKRLTTDTFLCIENGRPASARVN
jgi:hypothetical protein